MLTDDLARVFTLLQELLQRAVDDRFLVRLYSRSQRSVLLRRRGRARDSRGSVQLSRELVVDLVRGSCGGSWREGRVLCGEGDVFESGGGGWCC
jgi:hypothetical protein